MDTLNQIACKAQGNQWVEIGDLFTGCTTYENMRLVIAVSGAIVTMLFIMWFVASIQTIYYRHKAHKAQRTIMVLRDSLVIMSKES